MRHHGACIGGLEPPHSLPKPSTRARGSSWCPRMGRGKPAEKPPPAEEQQVQAAGSQACGVCGEAIDPSKDEIMAGEASVAAPDSSDCCDRRERGRVGHSKVLADWGGTLVD